MLILFIIIKSVGIFFALIGVLILSEFKSKINNYDSIDYIIVLGAGLDGDQVSNRLKRRLDEAYNGFHHLDIPIIVSGGQGPDELVSEAYAMAEYLIKRGINRNRLILEDQSTSTQENLFKSFKNIQEYRKNIAIVTSDYHMFRAKMLAKRLNMNVQGLTAQSVRKKLPKQFIREIFAVLKDLIVRKF